MKPGNRASRWGHWLSLAGLACCLLAIAAPARAAEPSATAAETWLLLGKAGETMEVAGPLEERVPELTDQAWTAAWGWSAEVPPTRHTWGEVEAGEAVLGAPSSQRLQVHVPGLEPRVYGNLTLRAAPRAMWLEVPEQLLPTWPLDETGRASLPSREEPEPWMLRVSGDGLGSWWIFTDEGSRRAVVPVVPAEDLIVRWTDAQGNGIEGVTVHAQEEAADRLGRAIAYGRAWTDSQGRSVWPSLPDSAGLRLLAVHGEYVPASVRGRVGSLPDRWTLDRGVRVEGRIADGEGVPIDAATVELTTQPAGFPFAWILRTRTDAEGRWELGGIEPGGVVATVRSAHHGALRRRLQVDDANGDVVRLGTWVLEPAVQVRLQVIDERGVGVPAAVVETPLDSRLTEESGWVDLSGVPATSGHEVRVRAEGHLPARKRLLPPHDPAEEIVLPRALVVRGRLVDAEGAPLGGGQVRVEDCDTWDLSPPSADGRFELALVPDRQYRLILSSPATRAVSVEVTAGAAGEIVELGDVVLPRGGVVRGRLVAEADAAPVAGARVWMPREAADPLMSWVRRDVLQTSSDSEGVFLLHGVPALPAELRVEALEFAPRRLDIRFEADANEVDLGDVELTPGHALEVVAEGFDPESALLRLDLAGAWREMDVVEAYFVDGAARLSRLPAGRFEVAVMRGREVLCRKRVEVGPGEPAQVACTPRRVQVHGTVVAADEPVGPGRLLWFPDTWGREAGMVIRREAAAGLGRSSTFGEGLPQVDVEVMADGSFSTHRLAAGRWRVVWQGDGGGGTEPVEIEIPELPEHNLRIEVPGQRLWGVVLDAAGEPAQGARVRLLDSGALAFAGRDGEFVFPALKPGRYFLKAERQGVVSSLATVELTSETRAPVELRLGEDETGSVSVQVRSASGDGIVGALVVVETSEGEQRLLTTGPRGDVELTMDPPWPGRLRAAGWTPAGWALGGWVAWREATEKGLVLEVADVGELVVTADDGSPAIDALRSAEGWDLVALLTRLGRPPRAGPSQRLHLRGLPAGTYWLSSGGHRVPVRVEGDRMETHQVR